MKQAEAPAAMRERLEACLRIMNSHGHLATDKRLSIATECYDAGWQAAQPSSEKIEAVARRINARQQLIADKTAEFFGMDVSVWAVPVDELRAILREELGGGTK